MSIGANGSTGSANSVSRENGFRIGSATDDENKWSYHKQKNKIEFFFITLNGDFNKVTNTIRFYLKDFLNIKKHLYETLKH
jgi:hypothetical protein